MQSRSSRMMVRPKRPPSNAALDDSDRAVGARVRQFRRAFDLTGQQLADELGITISSLSYIESGKRRLDPRHAGKILARYGVDHTWLYCGLPTGLTATTVSRLEKAKTPSSGSESSRSA